LTRKSKAGRRTIGLPLQLVALLRGHGAEQERDRELAGHLWQGEGWVFASPTGQPRNRNTDYHQWKRLLRVARLREARLDDARHAAATVLLLIDVPVGTVMSLMGWSSADMAARYQHVTDTIREGVAGQVDALIWQARDTAAGEGTVPVSRNLAHRDPAAGRARPSSCRPCRHGRRAAGDRADPRGPG
jgi:integrase